MHNVVKWPKILLKSCGVNTARFLKYVTSFYNIMHERVKRLRKQPIHARVNFTFILLNHILTSDINLSSKFVKSLTETCKNLTSSLIKHIDVLVKSSLQLIHTKASLLFSLSLTSLNVILLQLRCTQYWQTEQWNEPEPHLFLQIPQ